MSALAGYGGSVVITSTPNVTLTDYVLTDAGDHKTFNVPSADFATKRYWDRTVSFVIQTSPDGATWSTVTSGFTIRYVTGQVLFASAVTGATPGCRVHSGAYLPFSTFGMMKEWEVTPQMDLLDVSVFGTQWKQYQPSLAGATIKLSQFFVDGTLFTLAVSSSSNLCIASLKSGYNTTERWEGYVRLKGDDIKTAVNAAIEESIDAEIDGPLYHFTGQYS